MPCTGTSAGASLSLSVVVPALNEEENIAGAVTNVVDAMCAYGVSGEIIAVNDGSRDGTRAVLERLMAAGGGVPIRVIDHARPMGIGASFREGAAAARGDAVVMIPGDGENDAGEILRYIELLRDVDIVVPFVFNPEVRSRGRRLLSRLYRRIVTATFGLELHYTNGTVMYRRSILGDVTLASAGFLYQTELLVKLIRRGYLFAEVPCRLEGRASGGSRALGLRSACALAAAYARLLAEVRGAAGRGGAARGVRPDSATAARRAESGGRGEGASGG